MMAQSTAPHTLVLDGAAGTYLESLGVTMHPKLWGSGALLTPEGRKCVLQMHRAYYAAGADVATSLTYQASIAGFVDAGLTEQQAFGLMTAAVTLAREAAAESTQDMSMPKKVAAGLGPYGSYLAEGQEYSGDYGSTTEAELREFWLPRVKAVLAGDPDFLLFETIPNRQELALLIDEAVPLANAVGVPVWISLSVRTSGVDDVLLADLTPIADLKPLLERAGSIDAIGANCFDVRAVPRVLNALAILGLPLSVYPNSGEVYDGISHTWSKPDSVNLAETGWDPAAWAAQHKIRFIGGCCRTTPADIASAARALRQASKPCGF